MALSLYVETARWRAHQHSVLKAFPGLVPVAKGNGYGFGNRRLAEEATGFGAPMLAVGTSYEAAEAVEYFGGDVLVLTPYRIGEDPVPLPGRVVRTVAGVSGLRALVGARVLVECMTSMRRHGVDPQEVPKLATALDDVRLEGFALHLPLDRPDGHDPVREVSEWVRQLTEAGLPIPALYVSHLSAEEIDRLRVLHPTVSLRPRIGTRLWLGDHGATEYRGTVLDVTPVAKGDRYGYRQLKASVDGHLVVAAGGTAHGVGLEAPKYLTGVTPRAKNLARAGLATVNRTVSPFLWAGRKAAFAEPPHMQVSILFVPGDTAPPTVGEELRAILRHTTTHVDRTVDR